MSKIVNTSIMIEAKALLIHAISCESLPPQGGSFNYACKAD